jgi:hypothetical protein
MIHPNLQSDLAILKEIIALAVKLSDDSKANPRLSISVDVDTIHGRLTFGVWMYVWNGVEITRSLNYDTHSGKYTLSDILQYLSLIDHHGFRDAQEQAA